MPMLGTVEHDPVEHVRRFKPLSLLPLVALVFYDVSGGPFGIEVKADFEPRPERILGSLTSPLHPFDGCKGSLEY